ncbi:RloB family protein [Frankia sp. R82]|uniref:RloB family protein n=1 Tax=Frankia sp. R82 TaxID=2950553 RepID=UPI0020448941|nr:RloB family protein [Frankia sp. R82]MCM3882814.1 RloB family protein [Frankia sp. R82]
MRPEKKTFVIFCEGKLSEPDYINGIKKLPHVAANSAVSIEIDPERGVPLKLVQRAIERSQDQEIDECRCVFDVEWPNNHPYLKQAVNLARQRPKIRVAISNPCFELWLILHFERYTRFASTDDVERHSKRLDGRAGKGIDAAKYMPLRATAIANARALDAQHKRDNAVFPSNNPSSSMTDLLMAIDHQPGAGELGPSPPQGH